MEPIPQGLGLSEIGQHGHDALIDLCLPLGRRVLFLPSLDGFGLGGVLSLAWLLVEEAVDSGGLNMRASRVTDGLTFEFMLKVIMINLTYLFSISDGLLYLEPRQSKLVLPNVLLRDREPKVSVDLRPVEPHSGGVPAVAVVVNFLQILFAGAQLLFMLLFFTLLFPILGHLSPEEVFLSHSLGLRLGVTFQSHVLLRRDVVAPVDLEDLKAANATRPPTLPSVLLRGLNRLPTFVRPHVSGHVVPECEISAARPLTISGVFCRCMRCILTHLTPIDSIQTHSRISLLIFSHLSNSCLKMKIGQKKYFFIRF